MEKGKLYIWLILALVLGGCSRGIDEYVRQSRHVDVDVRVYGTAHPFFIREYSAFATSALVQALEHEGDERMAGAMLASDNPKLAKAARHWAYVRGMALVSPPRRLDDGG